MKRRFYLSALVGVMGILCSLYSSKVALALDTDDIVMSVSPASQELELQPGQKYQGKINVSNSGRTSFQVKVSTKPFYVKDETYDPVFSTDSAYTKLHNWIKLSEKSFTINPEEKHVLEFEITVPNDVAPGGQYAAIMFLSENEDATPATIKTSGRIATILYGHVNGGEARMSGELVDHKLPSLWRNSGISISQTVTNNGNIDFRVQQTMTIKEFFSNREVVNPSTTTSDGDTIGTSNVMVLPGTSRMSVLSWPDAPKLGLFQVTQNIDFLDQNYTFEQIVFICPIWVIAIIIGVIFFIIVYTVSRSRNKKNNQEAPIVETDS